MSLHEGAKVAVRAEFIRNGCEVSSGGKPQDFAIRTPKGSLYDVRVRSLKKGTYFLLEKTNFKIRPFQLLAFVRWEEGGGSPGLYLIPSSVNGKMNPILLSYDYDEAKQSPPEFGFRITISSMAALRQDYTFRQTLAQLK
jgi:hypothetical protein